MPPRDAPPVVSNAACVVSSFITYLEKTRVRAAHLGNYHARGNFLVYRSSHDPARGGEGGVLRRTWYSVARINTNGIKNGQSEPTETTLNGCGGCVDWPNNQCARSLSRFVWARSSPPFCLGLYFAASVGLGSCFAQAGRAHAASVFPRDSDDNFKRGPALTGSCSRHL